MPLAYFCCVMAKGILTSLLRPVFVHRTEGVLRSYCNVEDVQIKELRYLLQHGRHTRFGEAHDLSKMRSYSDFVSGVPVSQYSDMRPWVMRMVSGERDVLWPGLTRRFAQSSGTSDGKSKYIPVTDTSLRRNHYRGASDAVAHYLKNNPCSRLFDGKALILGGSFANELDLAAGVKVGDLSAHLIDRANRLVQSRRIPSRELALMADWNVKLPLLSRQAASNVNVTNISGVPSWFLVLLRRILQENSVDNINEVWPRLEVFFHGGISFAPYRQQYADMMPSAMRYVETYNASEGFFAVQDSPESSAMLMLMDAGVFYEFLPVDDGHASPIPAWQIEPGRVYSLLISSCNGLWRYAIGDTVRVETINPLRITISGRTKHYINAFGEELMVHNADAAIARACSLTGASVLNYTAAPVFATATAKGHHQWLIEFDCVPKCGVQKFADMLDTALCDVNSDYQAKRTGSLFLSAPEITLASKGLFDQWLANTGKLGGQRKVPRLSNTRDIIEAILKFNR